MRVCSTPGCPEYAHRGARGGRCPAHQREADKARGTKQQRGYDKTYDQQRAQWQTRIDAGEPINCWRCNQPITNNWNLGHDDHDRTIIRGPEHQHCNLSAAGKAAHNR